MLQINSLPEPLPPETLERLRQIPTAVISDALLAYNLPRGGCMDASLRPAGSACAFAGVALTVLAEHGNSLPVKYAICNYARAGYALTVATDGYTDGPYMGELVAMTARFMGMEAVVIDGYIRDRKEIAAMPMPCFCKGSQPRKPFTRADGSVNASVYCAGVDVNPGDVVLGDADGVLVLPRELLPKVLADSEGKKQADSQRRGKILNFFHNNLHNKQKRDTRLLMNNELEFLRMHGQEL